MKDMSLICNIVSLILLFIYFITSTISINNQKDEIIKLNTQIETLQQENEELKQHQEPIEINLYIDEELSNPDVDVEEIIIQTIEDYIIAGDESLPTVILTRGAGRVNGPSGEETWYNLPMGGVIRLMIDAGYEYEYWIREDGVKMYGEYIMVAADTKVRPKGTILETSLGTGMVCDHCEAAEWNPGQIDIAVAW